MHLIVGTEGIYLAIDRVNGTMNLQQIEYIVALDTHRSFAKAAAACSVTQPTLSSMVKKLEEELGVVLFDRSRAPVVCTSIGVEVVQHARSVLKELNTLKNAARGSHPAKGELRIGIIPTLAPYLVPLFLPRMLKRYKELHLSIEELTTNTIVERLSRERLDVGIMATPLDSPGLREQPLFNERFQVYASHDDPIGRKRYVLPGDIDPDRLWLLEEGHCLRSQVMNLCELRRSRMGDGHLHYVSGSIGSLLRIVDMHGGLTIVPELATVDMEKRQRSHLHDFKPPVPAREISTVTYRHSLRDGSIDLLRKEILAALSGVLSSDRTRLSVLPITQ